MTRTAALASSWRNAMAGLSALLLALLVVLGTPRPAGAEAAADAAEFVRDFSGRAIAVLADEGLSADRREEEFRRLLVAGVDVEVIGRFVLGPHWRKATDEQRAEFRRLFEALIVGTYARRLASYAGETLKVEGVRRQNEKMAAVSSRVIRPKGQPIPIYWRLRRGKDDWRIVDVVVEGVSMALTQRAEFNAVIKRNGGRIEGLLEKLRETTARSRGRPAEQVEASL